MTCLARCSGRSAALRTLEARDSIPIAVLRLSPQDLSPPTAAEPLVSGIAAEAEVTRVLDVDRLLAWREVDVA